MDYELLKFKFDIYFFGYFHTLFQIALWSLMLAGYPRDQVPIENNPILASYVVNSTFIVFLFYYFCNYIIKDAICLFCNACMLLCALSIGSSIMITKHNNYNIDDLKSKGLEDNLAIVIMAWINTFIFGFRSILEAIYRNFPSVFQEEESSSAAYSFYEVEGETQQ